MYLSQLKPVLAQTLSALAGVDSEGRKITVTEGQDNNLVPSVSAEPGSPEVCISPGYIKFWFLRKEVRCDDRARLLLSDISPEESGWTPFHTDDGKIKLKNKDGEIIDDCLVTRRWKSWMAFFQIRSVRCESADILDRLCLALDYETPGLELHPCIKMPKISDVDDFSQISTGENWQSRTQATLSVEYGHATIIKPPCRPIFNCVTARVIDKLRKKEAANVSC